MKAPTLPTLQPEHQQAPSVQRAGRRQLRCRQHQRPHHLRAQHSVVRFNRSRVGMLVTLLVLSFSTATFAADDAPGSRAQTPARFEVPTPPRLQVKEQLTLDNPVIFGFDEAADDLRDEDASKASASDAPGDGDQAGDQAGIPSMHTPLHRGPVHRIQIETVDGERLTLQSQRHVTFGKDKLIFKTTTRTYEDVCTTPCDLEVAEGAYRFAVADADNWRRARTLEIRRRVIIDDDSLLLLSHRNRRGARAGFYSAMAASVVAGFAVAMVSAIEQRDESRELSPQRTPTMRALSVSLVGAGLGFFIGGVMSRDHYRVQHVPVSAAQTP